MPWTIRSKLVLLSLLILVVVSFAFTLLHLSLSRSWIEEDLRERAVAFAREIAATIGGRREFENAALLERQIRDIMAVRSNVLQLDVLAFTAGDSRIVATSHPRRRLPLTRKEAEQVRRGGVVSRLVSGQSGRYWEIVAPVRLDAGVAGAVAVEFSLDRADALAGRIRRWALLVTAASVLVMGALMSLAVHGIVDRPLRRFLATVHRVREGDTAATVTVAARDEFGELAYHFNAMTARIHAFSEELQVRVGAATRELEGRYREVDRLNAQLFTMQRSLSHAERLALAGRIMAEVAHEVGTPLHSIAGHLELLRQDLSQSGLTPGFTRRLDIVEGQLARVTQIIAGLLDVTRRPTGDPSLIEVNSLVHDTVDLVRPQIVRAGIDLEIRLDPAPLRVRGHAGPLQQVVLNLLTNALDATPAGHRIGVATRAAPSPDEVEIEVRDTGSGIPATEQKRIFEPFFSTKEPGRGSGLGLFISAQIVQEHRGRIELDSEEGRGSVFRVLLPVVGRGA
ncbi:MAG TPA: ATP-binding protein [Methylomirabilota bacterium]